MPGATIIGFNKAHREELRARISGAHQIPGLDALRVLAVGLVLAFHFRIPVSGPMGVMIFFVLSGFLITGVLLAEYTKKATISLRTFYSRRAFRIFPTFYACWLLTTVGLWLHHEPIDKLQAVASFFYLTDYLRALCPISGQTTIHMWISWSLAVEEQYYLIWPAALLWILRNLSEAAWATALLISGIWIYRAVLVLGFHVSPEYIYNAFDTRLDGLLVGSFLAILVRQSSVPKLISAIRASKWLVLVPATLLALASMEDLKQIYSSALLFVISMTLQPLIVAALLVQVVHWADHDWRFLENPGIKLLARLSYALYLYHIFALDEMYRLGLHHKHAAAAVLTLCLACASYFLVERPMLNLRERLFGEDKAIPPERSIAA